VFSYTTSADAALVAGRTWEPSSDQV
jgi:hypothetical protein